MDPSHVRSLEYIHSQNYCAPKTAQIFRTFFKPSACASFSSLASVVLLPDPQRTSTIRSDNATRQVG